MRIAVVTSLVASVGGNGEDLAVLDQCALLTAAGHDVALFARSSDHLRRSRTYKAKAAVTVATGHGPSPLPEIRDFAPDVVHVHNTYPNVGRSWVRDLDQPLVVTLHSFRFFCARATLFRDGHVCTECVESPLSAVRHGCYENALHSVPYSVAGLRRRSDPLLNRAQRIVVLNPRMRDYLIGARFDATRIVVGRNTVPEPPPAISADRDGGWLYVGRLTEEKGILRLLERWPSGEKLTVIGDGPVMEPARSRAGRNVTVLGAADRAATLQAMARATGLIIPSLSFEGMPLVYLEALAAGLPVIAFEPNAVADLVRAEGTGITATWDDPLKPTLESARALFDALGDHCREVFAQRYSPSSFVRDIEAVYTDAIAEHGRGWENHDDVS